MDKGKGLPFTICLLMCHMAFSLDIYVPEEMFSIASDDRVGMLQNNAADECPGMIHNNSECACGGNYGGLIKKCSSDAAELRRGAWIGTLPNTSLYLAGICPYCYHTNAIVLPKDGSNLNDIICNSSHSHRTGVLCGQCQEGYGISTYNGLHCVRCHATVEKYSWLFYILSDIIPLTLFFAIVVIFNVSATSGPGNGFIFFAQAVMIFSLDRDGAIFQKKNEHFLETASLIMYSLWSLDFFQSDYCLSSKVSAQLILSLGYINAVFPLILVVILSALVWAYGKGFRPVVYLLAPLHKCFATIRKFRIILKLPWNLSHSILHALATFLVLSYTKFALVSSLLLTETPLIDDSEKVHQRVFYYNGSVKFMGDEHRPFAFLSISVILTFVALPPIVLIIPSLAFLLKRVSKNCFKRDRNYGTGSSQYFQQYFLQFLNTFHGCYKDGTGSGDIDCRWFAGFYFVLRWALFANHAFAPSWHKQYFSQQLVCIVALLMIIILRPYKNNLYNIFDALIFANLATLSAISMYTYHVSTIGDTSTQWLLVFQYILIFFPLLHIVLYIAWKKCCHKNRADNKDERIESCGEDAGTRLSDLEFSQHTVELEKKHLLQVNSVHYGATKSVVTINACPAV